MQTMSLPVELTDEESLARGAELARKVQEIADLEDEKAQAAKDAAAEIKRVAQRVADLSHIVASGKEYRDVEIDVRKNLAARTMETHRIDTGELVISRGLTAEELQAHLFPVVTISPANVAKP